MENSSKSWVCCDCQFLSLLADLAVCDSHHRYQMGSLVDRLPEARCSVAPRTSETQCNYKVKGANEVFDFDTPS